MRPLTSNVLISKAKESKSYSRLLKMLSRAYRNFRFQRLTVEETRSLADYTERKARWDCERRVKSCPDPLPSDLRVDLQCRVIFTCVLA